MLKRMLSLLLSLLLVVSMLPMGVLAEELANEEPTQAVSEEAPDNSEPVEASDPSEPTESPDPSEPAEAPAPSEPAEAPAPSEPADPSEPSEAPDPSEATEEPVITVTSADGLTELSIGDRLQLTVTVLPEYPNPVAPFWSSSDEAVAAVDQTGLVTGISAGTVTITVQCGELQAAMDLTVTSPLDPDPTTEPEDATVIISGSGVYVNPMYAGTVDISPDDLSPAAALAEEEPYTDVKDIVVPLRAYMCARADSASLPLEIPAAEYDEDSLGASLSAAIEQAMAHTGVPTQGDYLRANFRGAAYDFSGSFNGTTAQLQLSFQFEYNDNADQEEEMDAAVSALLAQLSPSGTDYQKIRTVYDYITANITYDYTNLNDDTYLLKYSPYAALVNKTAVCQGYAGLLYRLALEMGVSCRMITGTANGGHAWNIIGLDGSYYNVDATWDAGRADYAWFLLTDANFSDHTRDSAYASSSFYSAYPMGSENYTPAQETEPQVLSSGSCGANLTYTLTDDGVLTITGSGAMAGYNMNQAPWYDYLDQLTSVVLSEGVTSIGRYAFYGYTALTTVSIPQSVNAIEYGAFQGCSALTAVSIPEGVTAIETNAFNSCKSMTSVSIPQGVTRIGTHAFGGCSGLTSITIPESVTVIEYAAFSGCSGLTSFTIPQAVTSIGGFAFSRCTGLTSISIPGNVTSIGSYAFQECTGLAAVNLPEGITSIGKSAFEKCSSLSEIIIPEGVTALENYIFSGCTSLTSITIPKSVSSLSSNAFNSCSKLSSVTFGGTMLEWIALASSWKMAALCADGTVLDWGSCGDSLSYFIGNGVLTISGSGTMTDYTSSSKVPWFSNRDQITALVLPEGLTSIGSYAFYSFKNLTSVTIPDSVTSIGSYAFRDCSALTSVTIPDSVTSIGSYAFWACSALTSVTIPQGITSIEVYAFRACQSLTTFTIPDGVTSIRNGAFSYCSNLISITIPQSVTTIEDSAFAYCTSLASITIPKGITALEVSTFSGCENLATIVFLGDGFNGYSFRYPITAYYPKGNTTWTEDIQKTFGQNVTWVEMSCTGGIDHNIVADPAVAPSCTETGLTEGSHCALCGEVFAAQQTVPATGHTKAVDEATAPTCTESGLTEGKHCSVCGEVLTPQEVIPATGHTEVIDEAVAPTCTESGLTEGKHCSACGDVLTPQQTVPATGHTEVIDEAVAPTCTESGLTEGKHCSVCGETLVAQQVVPAAHKVVIDEAAAATCTESGLTQGSHCSACGEVLTPQEIIPATGHTEVIDEAVVPTCTESGLTEGKHCSVCGEVLTAQTVIPATGHTEVVDEAVAPTCTESGLTEGKHCSVCGEVLTAQTVIPAAGHNEVIDEAVAPTCTESGLTEGSHCGICGEVLTAQTVIPATGHTEVVDEAVMPTCTGTGLTEGKHCSVCGEVLTAQQVIPATGHNYVDGVCTVCGGISSGSCGENLTYTITEDGVLTITGTGAMTNYSYNSTAPWYANRAMISRVVLPHGLTSIGNYAFYECTKLASVTLPGGVTAIGSSAFQKCSALKSVSIPTGVTSIGNSAFYGCSQLTSVSIPQGVTAIASSTFSGCAALTSVSIPAGVTSIGTAAFEYCTSLESVSIPEGVTSIGSWAFSDCSSLESLSIPQGVTAIKGSTFYGCTSLRQVSIPDGVTSIGGSAFCNCSALESVSIPDSVNTIEASAFYGCATLKEVTIPKGVTAIRNSLFSGCTALESVSIPDGVVSIENSAFSGCTALTSVNIPQDVTSIGNNAFYNCSSLTAISVPDSVTSIGSCAFQNCSSLLSVSIPQGVSKIENSTFYGCSSLVSVALPDSITSIGTYVFYNCTALESISIPEAVASIGEYAFYNCSSLESIAIPQGVAAIVECTFYGCSSLVSVSIPASVTSVGSNAFRKCTALKEITFGQTVSDSLTVGENAFLLEGTTALNTLVRVPYTREIHPAVSGYDWAGSMRTVTYLSTENLPATALTINTHLAEIEAGLELALTASVEPSNTTSEILWSIDEARSTGTASIDENGILVGLTPGLVTVRVTSADDSAVFDETTVTILAPTAEAEGIVVTGDWEFANEVEAGATLQMIPTFIPGNTADKSVTWSVDNGTGSATIDQNGLLTALTPGTVTVWAVASNEVAGSCSLNIVRYAGDITIFLDGSAGVTSLGVGQRMILSAQVSPEDATCQEVVWSVEDGTGSAKLETYSYYPPQITGLTPGTVTLLATSKDNRAISVSVELTISDVIGTYALPDGSGNLYYNRETGVITGCDSTVINVSIPASIDGVSITSIAPYAFCPRNHYGSGDGLKKLVSVSIPASVTAIGDHAFTNCSALTTVRINTDGNLTTIGDYAFDNCQKLGTLRLNTNGKLTSIGTYAFSECEALTTLTIPDGVTTIGERAFFYCVGITDMTIPDSVTSVGREAFEQLKSLKNLTIPGELDTRDWLWCASSVESVTFTGTRVVSIPHTVNSGGGINYSDMPGRNVKRVVISEGITTIEPYAFFCSDLITEVVLPEGLLTMGERAFSNCNSLEQMKIPQSLQSVGRNCFAWCEKLQLIDLSAVPDKLVEQEYSLDGKANIPTWLVRASGGKNYLEWECRDSEGEIGLYWSPDGIFLWANGTARCQLVCYDTYSGARGSKWVEASAGLAIRPADVSVLSAGEQLQLSAWMMPDEQKVTASWSLGEGDSAYAILSSTGLLTAKNVTGAHQITVTASAQGETATAKLWILPRTTALLLYTVGSDTRVLVGQSGTAVQTLDTDMFTAPTLALQAVSQPEDASAEFIWSSSAAAVAQVDENGNVTLRKPGTATITAAASDGSGVKVSVKLNVIYLDEAKTLTAVAEAPEIGLQPDETTQMQVFGTDKTVPLDASSLSYSIPDNQQHIAAVESSGRITALTPGTVTVTARIPGDPLNRSASVEVKVIPTQSAFLHLNPDVPDGEVQILDENLCCVLLDMTSRSRTFTLFPEAADQEGRPISLGKSDVNWVTTDSKLAALTLQSDGSARVTVPAGASGACAIRGVTNDLVRNSASVWVFVRDYAPQLETASLTMNSYLTQGVSTGLTESYGNTIEALELYEYDTVAKAYADTPSARLTARYENSRLTLTSASNLPNGTVKLLLRARCSNGQTYNLPITLKIANKLPSVTVKQPQKFNLFYRDSEAQLLVTVKGQTITGITLADTEDFALSYDPDSGVSTIRFSDSYLADHSAAADTKATLCIFLAGWNSPVTKAVTIGTVTTKPSLTTDPSASVVNTALASAPTASIRVRNKATGTDLDLSSALIGVEAPFAQAQTNGDTLTLTLNASLGGTAKLTILDSGWMQPITLTHKVTVQTALPKVTLGASTLKLNRYLTMQTASASMTSSQSNLPIDRVEFQPKAAPGTAARLEADKLARAYVDGRVTFSIPDAANAPKAGTYVFTYTAFLADGTALPSGTIKVTMDASLPKVKLASTSLKLNRFLSGSEVASTTASVYKNPDYELINLIPGETWPQDLGFAFEEGTLRVTLLSGTAALQRRSLSVNAVLRHIPTGQEITLPTALALSVQVYESQALSVSLSTKGKLDTQKPGSALTYTVSRMNNCTGIVEDVTLAGADADKFTVRLVPDAAKPTAELTMKPGIPYSTKTAYKVQLLFRICGQDVASSVLTVKVSQSALKFTKPSGSALYRQSQTVPLTHTVTATSGLIGEIRLNENRTSPDFLSALADDGFECVCSADGTQAVLTFRITRPANLIRNKSYTVYLDVIPVNCAVDKAPTTLKLTVKVLS